MTSHKLHKVILKDKKLLNKGSTKETYQIILDEKNINLSFKPGDSVAIIPKNDPSLVDLCIKKMDSFGELKIFHQRTKNFYTLKNFLTNYANISKFPSSLLNLFLTDNSPLKNKDNLHLYLKNHELWDMLEEFFPQKPILPQTICSYLLPLLPRLYSISSSPLFYKDEIHLTITLVSYVTSNIKRYGVATNYLCNIVKKGEPIQIYIQPNPYFLLPTSSNADIIMISAGTGISPFLSFIQHRYVKKEKGKNWLFFGERNRKYDFYYEKFLLSLEKENFLKLDLAFSRDQKEKIYVQDKILEKKKEIFNWLEKKCYVYICGNKDMAKEVDYVFKELIQKEGKLSSEQASSYFSSLISNKRYLKDVY
ncbi:MAG: hypothetical protein AMS24_04015 [Chlamydiae bacterium SM23_39]|nr:MAG: hypothetical protein AMS24_04015 [Chlamydiae bacterium SM23_39]